MSGAVVVVSPEPVCGVVLNLADRREHVLIEPFVPDRPVVAFDIGVLLRLARLNILKNNRALRCPLPEAVTDIFRAVVDPDAAGTSAPLNDPLKRPDHAARRQREVTSMPSPSRLKSSTTLSSRKDLVSSRRSAMKSIDQTVFG